MGGTDAVILDDLISETDGLSIRPGYTEHASLTGTNVTSLIRWFTTSGEKLISSIHNAPDHILQDVSTSTPVTIATTGGGYWRHAQLAGQLGLVNGADQPTKLDIQGTNIVRKDMSISGLSGDRLRRIAIFKSRSYFATGDEPAFWYSAVGALGGTLTRFPIDRVTNTGGNVIEMSAWTRDGGSGPDDFFVLFLDTGEVVVYQGSNPGDANDWALVGLYSLGGVLAVTRFSGKIHVVTDFDYNIVPDDLITSGFRSPSKLSGAARDAVKQFGGQWQIFIDPSRGWRIVNIPSNTRQQHVLNMRTGGISRTHYPANVWQLYKGDLYFGGDGAVYRVEGTDDDGSAISWALKQAFIDTKRDVFIERYRPIWSTPGNFTFESGLAFDYESQAEFLQGVTASAETVTPWGSEWGSEWSTQHQTKDEWQLGLGRGTAVSLMMNGSSTTGGTFLGTDFEVR